MNKIIYKLQICFQQTCLIFITGHKTAIKFNPNKTESVLFTRRNINNPPVYFGDMDNRVTDVNVHCHLGLDLQSNCKWGDYVSKIYKKACDTLNILRMIKYQVDRNVLINIYLSCIRPMLKYGRRGVAL